MSETKRDWCDAAGTDERAGAAGAVEPCPYLPGRRARLGGFVSSWVPPGLYARLLEQGFRRSGEVFYRPVCPGCEACVPIRIAPEAFRPTRSQRRVWRRNADVEVIEQAPVPTRVKWEVFRRYLAWQHDGSMSDAWEDFARYLYCSPVPTRELVYVVAGELMAVSIVDVCGEAVSSVYAFFDPRFARRSPGTFSILWEIDMCRRQGVRWYYLGYHVAGSRTMDYKARFGPHERRVGERWIGGACEGGRGSGLGVGAGAGSMSP